MSFSINTNVASLQAMNYLTANSRFQAKTINEVTSGLRIVNSGDDAAGLAIANGYRSDVAVLTQGIQNANDGLSTLQTIDGGMSNISQLLDRARTLATQSASGTFNGSRTVLDNEFQSVLTEINRQAQSIGMNTGGAFAKALSVFIGGGRDATGNATNAGAVSEGSVSVNLSNSAVDTRSLGLTTYNATPSAAANLTTITTAGNLTNGSFDLNFSGAGFSAGANGVVTVTALGVNNAKTLADVVTDINNGITTAASQSGSAAAAFAADGIQAQLNAAGSGIVFTSATGGFAVTDNNGGNGSVAALNVLGGVATGVPVISGGTEQVTLTQPTALGAGETQDLTFSATDPSGTLTQVTAHLLASQTKDQQIAIINTALHGASTGSPLLNVVAYDSDASATGNVVLSGNTPFQVFVGNGTAGDGMESAGNQGVFATSATSNGSGQLDVLNQGDAGQAVTALANAVANLGSAQAVVGKGENTLTYATNLAQSQMTNESTSESGIRDANMATEAANLTKAQILLQAGVAALAQANAAPQNILALLKG
jgi:flagellin